MNKAALFSSIEKKLQFSFARSSGAGGQNVNKVNTKVRAAIPLFALEGLTSAERSLVKKRLANKINSAGELCVECQEERFQERNRALALDKIKSLVVQAALVPKKRRPTCPTRTSIEKRLKTKKLRAKIKLARHKF